MIVSCWYSTHVLGVFGLIHWTSGPMVWLIPVFHIEIDSGQSPGDRRISRCTWLVVPASVGHLKDAYISLGQLNIKVIQFQIEILMKSVNRQSTNGIGPYSFSLAHIFRKSGSIGLKLQNPGCSTAVCNNFLSSEYTDNEKKLFYDKFWWLKSSPTLKVNLLMLAYYMLKHPL